MRQRNVRLAGAMVVQHGVPLAEGSPAAVLSAQAHGSPVEYQRSEGQRLGQRPVDPVRLEPLPSPRELPRELGVRLEVRRRALEPVEDDLELFPRHRGLREVLG